MIHDDEGRDVYERAMTGLKLFGAAFA